MKKSFKKLKYILSFFIVTIMLVTLSACSLSKSEKQKKLNIFLDTNDKFSSNVIKFLIEDFKKNNPDVEIKINDALGDKSDILEKINIGTEIDLLFTSRNTLIELSKKGVLSDMKSDYEKNSISERYYNIVGSYGRVVDKYYGIGVVPYSVELLFNKANLEKLKIDNPKNLEQWLKVLKQVNSKGIKTPVVLTEDVDVNALLFSLIASKVVNIHELEGSYDSGEQSYKKNKAMQQIFNQFNSLTKDNGITANTFEVGNEESINSFNNGDAPLMACISYYNSKLNGSNIGIISDYNNNSNYGSNIPIIINSLVCSPLNAKNGDTAEAFIKYIYSDQVQAKIVEKGIISGNKIANNKVSGIGKVMVQHMSKANDNSILILYNFPEKIKNNLLITLKRILSGGYNSNEWEDLLKKSYE